MSTLTTAVHNFVADEDGVTALEYGMIAALIAGAIVLTVKLLGTNIDSVLSTLANAIKPA